MLLTQLRSVPLIRYRPTKVGSERSVPYIPPYPASLPRCDRENWVIWEGEMCRISCRLSSSLFISKEGISPTYILHGLEEEKGKGGGIWNSYSSFGMRLRPSGELPISACDRWDPNCDREYYCTTALIHPVRISTNKTMSLYYALLKSCARSLPFPFQEAPFAAKYERNYPHFAS